MENTFQIINGNALDALQTLPSESARCCVTSPPYWSLRDYGIPGQIGWEDTPDAFASALGDVFDEVRRVLTKDGTLWLNLGDSSISAKSDYMPPQTIANGKLRDYITKESGCGYPPNRRRFTDYKPKDLAGTPWLTAFELRSRGWYLRQDIIWSKPNPMPESVEDRPTRSHEYIFLLTKSQRYYYNHEAIKEPSVDPESYTGRRQRNAGQMAMVDLGGYKFGGSIDENGKLRSGQIYETRNKRSVWEVNTRSLKDAHFATFPEKLIEPCILAGSAQGDTVLDPFSGAGTTGLVSLRHRRNFIGIELNPSYIAIAERRLREVQVNLF